MLLVRPQKMAIMDVVWPVTALYWGPVGVWGLWDMGSPPVSPAKRMEQKLQQDRRELEKAKGGQDQKEGQEKKPSKPFWQQVAVGVTHCGAGCTLGDIVGEWLVFAFGWKLFGDKLYAEFLVDFPLAYLLGIGFQYATIAPMRGLGLKDGIIAALKPTRSPSWGSRWASSAGWRLTLSCCSLARASRPGITGSRCRSG